MRSGVTFPFAIALFAALAKDWPIKVSKTHTSSIDVLKGGIAARIRARTSSL